MGLTFDSHKSSGKVFSYPSYHVPYKANEFRDQSMSCGTGPPQLLKQLQRERSVPASKSFRGPSMTDYLLPTLTTHPHSITTEY